ncbi:hypothetical protein, partial [Streptomyces roseochromogenus]|uniref:hypothetical protein n=1 Tax=Streptomyces roseochromogenus TaxID=285450 RepID=UPI0004CE9DB2
MTWRSLNRPVLHGRWLRPPYGLRRHPLLEVLSERLGTRPEGVHPLERTRQARAHPHHTGVRRAFRAADRRGRG